MENLTPRERRQARTREDILAAALSLINERGPDKFSLRALADRVDYSPAGLYEYFDGKDDIIAAVCAEGDRRLRGYLRAVPQSLPPDQYLVELGMAYVRYAEHNLEHFKLMFGQTPEGPPVPFEAIEQDETFGILLDAVKAGFEAGIIEPREEYGQLEIAYGMYAVAHGIAMLHISNLRNVAYDLEAADRVTLETFIRGLRPGLHVRGKH
jgi:AcrR family transcriptional regulator